VDAETEERSKERAACVQEDQYARYVIIDDIHINGKLTLGEECRGCSGSDTRLL